jgi:hypothetical protein
MDFYSTPSKNTYIVNRYQWFTIPRNTNQAVLVVPVSQEEAVIWVVTYTILVGLIFAAMTRLMAGLVIAFFDLGQSGTRHAMLVAFINTVNNPSTAAKLMFDYAIQSVFRSKRGSKRTIDRSALRGSLLLFGMAGAMVSGGIITKYLLGGQRLVIFHAAPVNPGAMFYPVSTEGDINAGNKDKLTAEAFTSLKRVRSSAIYQAIGRQEVVREELDKRVTLKTTTTSGDRGLEIRFEYHYNLTGFEMGIRDAPGLQYNVSGHCNTAYDGVFQFDTSANGTALIDQYPYFGNRNDMNEVVLNEEQFTAPFGSVDTDTDQAGLDKSMQDGGYRFSIIPHTAYKFSLSSNDNDPWYQTEDNPNIGTNWPYDSPYRVKRYRPPLYCTQNDTYTHEGVTVNHVDKLYTLPKLKMSYFIRALVFSREFGAPVFLPIMANVNHAALASSVFFDTNQRNFEAQYASITEDFKRLTYIAFTYSREVVRNTALLYPTLDNSNLENVAKNGTDAVPAIFADIFIDTPNVAALDVRVMVATPCVTIVLWFLVFVWSKVTNPKAGVRNHGFRSRHILRSTALQAVQLYRYLDEQISGKRKWSGRLIQTPYIRDLNDEANVDTQSAQQMTSPEGATELPRAEGADTMVLPTSARQRPEDLEAGIGQSSRPPMSTRSRYIRPKVVLAEGLEPEKRELGWFKELIWNPIWGPIRGLFGKKPDKPVQPPLELVMIQGWIPGIYPANTNTESTNPGDAGQRGANLGDAIPENTNSKNTTLGDAGAIHWRDIRANV